MGISLLNLISTPVPVLNSIGLNLRVGLSSEDPTVVGHPSEPYDAYLTVYSPEGLFLERQHLGHIPSNRRKLFDLSSITQGLVPDLDHLAVVHRIPSRLVAQVSQVEEEIDLDPVPRYRMFRSMIEYSFPQGGNGSVIYETPPRLNDVTSGRRSSNTLTFTCQTVLSPTLNTYVILIHYSEDPEYSRIATYYFALHAPSGDQVYTGHISIAPFSIEVLDLARLVPADLVDRYRDPEDGLCSFSFIGRSEDASLPVMVINAAPASGSVAVEHTHPSQAYVLPWNAEYQRQVKNSAQRVWRDRLSADRK